MIHGLKVVVQSVELKELCLARANHHRDRAFAYSEQIKSMESNKIEGMAYTNGNPIQSLKDRRAKHENEASELLFIANHLVGDESYMLEHSDLEKLGIVSSRY